MKYSEWIAEGERRFGKDPSKWRFKCCQCGNVQTPQDFRAIGVNPDEVVFYSCIGRWLPESKGEIGNKKKPCNYTLGGLFKFNTLEVENVDGEIIPVFEFADV